MSTTTSPNWNVEKYVALIGLVSSLIGVVSTWVTLQYRIDSLEEKSAILESIIKDQKDEMYRMERDFNLQGHQVRCDICRAHKMECPGC